MTGKPGLVDTKILNFWDVLLVATMLEQGIDTIWSEDAHLSKVPGLTMNNQFLPA